MSDGSFFNITSKDISNMDKFYAIYHDYIPISVKLWAKSLDLSIKEIDRFGDEFISDGRSDAEDEFEFDGAMLDNIEFAEALRSCGLIKVHDTLNLERGWEIWQTK